MNYDSRIFGYDWDPIESVVVDYFTTSARLEDIYEAIHVDYSTKIHIFEMNSAAVGNAFASNNMEDFSMIVADLINSKHPVMIYAGEFDIQDGPKG